MKVEKVRYSRIPDPNPAPRVDVTCTELSEEQRRLLAPYHEEGDSYMSVPLRLYYRVWSLCLEN